MGIPSYFSYIVKNYPTIVKRYINSSLKIDNLYLDCNSIVYDAYSKLEFDKLTENIAISIIMSVITKIEEYIHIIQPLKTVHIAFDGVAPLAKLEQQRSRRYKSWYQNEMARIIFQKEQIDPWNTASITPGTKFMTELNSRVSRHFTKYNSNKNINIIVSGSNKIGEGEHKIFDYIRQNRDKHIDETTVIYGLDADLIMLSINHLPLCPNLFLFRETPHFIKSIDNSLEPNANYLLNIPEFANAIIKYMNDCEDNEDNNNKSANKNFNTNKIYDYIFICFFLGNDFLPHFPSLNIRTGGIDKMINAYKATIGNTTLCLTDGQTIYWNNVRKLVQYLADLEEEYFIKEHRSRNNKERQQLPNSTSEDKFKQFELTPLYDREMEHYINPVKPNWQHRYYRGLFGIYNDTNDQLRDISINYLEGLEWTMKYYTTGCPNWRYKYRFNYPPLLQDLIRHIPIYNTEFVPFTNSKPVSEIVQLCYVLPRPYLNLLPQKLCFKLLQEHDDWYKGNCEFVWAYCRYFWEAHVDMCEIDINELEKFIDDNKSLLT